jgi:TPR repeat protein
MGTRVDTARVRVVGPVVGLAVVLLAACGSAAAPSPRQPAADEAAPPSGPSGPLKCIADRTPEKLVLTEIISCVGEDEARCVGACDGGDGQACRQLAADREAGPDGDYATDADADPQGAALLYARGCHLGDASACTNYGAYLLHATGGVDRDEVCAARLHALTCEAGDPWGCGMRGLELGNGLGVAKDVVAARKLLARSCQTYGGFPCQVLADLVAEEDAQDAAAR